MGFLNGIFKARDKPADRTSGSSYSFFWGNSTAGKRVNERTAMQMTAVYSCVRILSEALASLLLQFYRYFVDYLEAAAFPGQVFFRVIGAGISGILLLHFWRMRQDEGYLPLSDEDVFWNPGY